MTLYDSGNTKQIYVVDDHPLVRSGLIHLVEQNPELKVIGQDDGSSGVQERVVTRNPDLLILDLNLKDISGLDVLRDVKIALPNLKVLIISMHEDPAYVHAALRAGASGYLLKTNETDLIPIAIQTILKEGSFLSGSLQALIHAENPKDALTDREIEVIRGVVQGLGAKELAEYLQISHRTVEVHRANAMRKLNAKNIAELARIAVEKGFHQPLRPQVQDKAVT